MIYVVRHGQTEWNRDGKLQGMRNSRLTLLGVSQAINAGNYFKGLPLSKQPQLVFCSPLQRCQDTFLNMDLHHLLEEPVIMDYRLCERRFGAAEGLTHDEACAAFPDYYAIENGEDLNARWFAKPPRGESREAVRMRLDHFLADYQKELETKHCVIVCHGAVSYILRGILLGKDSWTEFHEVHRQKNNEIFILDDGLETSHEV